MKPARKILIGGAMAAATITGGALGVSFIGTAGAQTTSSTPSTAAPSQDSTATTPDPGRPQGTPDWSKGGHQANGKTETLLSGDDAAKAKAAAEAAVPGATSQRIETDAEGDVYEVHMTKADGSIVTVKLDSNFNVTKTVNGMG